MTKEIILPSGHIVLVDDADHEWLMQWKWHRSSDGYAVRKWREFGQQRSISMHRALLNPPDGVQVDHANGSRLDNRRANIRTCDQTHNSANRHEARGSSWFKGVCWSKQQKKWKATLVKYRKQIHGGHFANEEDAARAYDALAREHFGEFAWTNFKAPS